MLHIRQLVVTCTALYNPLIYHGSKQRLDGDQ